MSRNCMVEKVLRLEQLERRNLLAGDVYISEFSASNDDVLVDEDGDSPDWIEITNGGSQLVNLADWHLTDDEGELNKWTFPNQDLGPGDVLLVYASDKDRSVAGEPLHTNFKLASGGEYLALSQTTGPQAIEVHSEFTPRYPAQFTDISYGLGQTKTELVVSDGNAAGKYFIPSDDALGQTWTQLGFVDEAWQDSAGGIGYQRIVPGFTVQAAAAEGRIENLSEALAVLDGEGQASQSTVVTPVVDFTDNSFGGFFEGGEDFPNGTAGNDDDFAVRATGIIEIPESGSWILGFISDDGARMILDGEVIIDADVLRAPEFSFEVVDLEAGEYELEVIYFERGGGAELEIFTGRSFEEPPILIGDIENGGIPVFTSGGGGTAVGVGGLFETEIGDELQGTSTDVYLRIPFEVANPSMLDSLTLRVNYDDGFVAYINGLEVARRNAPNGDVAANAVATETRSGLEVKKAESIDVSDFLDQLQVGPNVLAIHGLNDDIASNSFLVRAELAEVAIDAGELFFFREPSPGVLNPESGVEGFLTDEISLSHEHGYYEESFELAMTSRTPGTTIRYTLDGSEPTAENGIDYVAPIMIDRTLTVRARAFKTDLDPSLTETASFLFLADIVQQDRQHASDLGFPRSANGQTFDYGMDPDIVESAEWGPQLEAAFEQIPSMSIVMDMDDFAGRESGIYSHANSHGRAWERPASLELIYPDGTQGFQTNMGIRIRGGFSRTGSNPKHAFRLFFRGEYGATKLEYPLFGEEGVDEFDKIDLRTTQNYSWAFQGDSKNAFVRDVFSRDLQREMGQPYTRSRFYHLYINGVYWGLYQTQERAEARYAASYYGGSPDDYDVIKSAGRSGGYANEATDGNTDAYYRLAEAFYSGLGDDRRDAYMRVQGMNPDGSRNPDFERLLDVENLIDYMIITYFTGDRDGPASRFVSPRVNNYFAILNRENPDGFKFFEHDSEHSLDTGEPNMVSPLTTGGSFEAYFNPHWMHEQLAETNADYRTQFMDRVYETLFSGGVMSADNVTELIAARAAEIDMAIIAESARWGDAKRSTPFTKDDWENAVASAQRFAYGRLTNVRTQLERVGWYPETGVPGLRVNGRYHAGAISPSDVLTFDNAGELDFRKRFTRERTSWRRLDDGSDQGTAWREIDFDDSSWASGRVPVGYGEGDETTQASFGDDANDKHVTTYFRDTFTASADDNYEGLRLRLVFDDGAVVYLNGQEVVRLNMPAGDVSFDTGALTRKTIREDDFVEVVIPTDHLVDGTNVFAVEVHQFIDEDGKVRDDDLSFDASLYGGVPVEEPVEVYYTTDGTDPRLPGGEIAATATRFETGFQLAADTEVWVRAKVGDAWGVLRKSKWEIQKDIGDLNGDQILSAEDIDTLAAAIRDNSIDARFDLNQDGTLDESDLHYIVESIFRTQAGDTDLDGDVDFADFLTLSGNFGEAKSGWSEGNFGTDTVVDFADFLALSANFSAAQPRLLTSLS